MQQILYGIFNNSKAAGEAVAKLKDAGYTDTISVVAKDWEGSEIKEHQVKSSVMEGGVIGAVVGGLAGLIIGVSAVAIPGLGTLLVAGPLTVAWTAGGAITGGLIGVLVDAGLPENQARKYEDAVRRGEVLVAVSSDADDQPKIRGVLEQHHATEIYQTTKREP